MLKRVCGMMAVLTAGTVCAGPAGFWRFEEGKSGETAGSVASAANAQVLAGKAGVFEKGTPPVFDAEVPHKVLWDGATATLAAPTNGVSLRFRAGEVTGNGSPVGGEVVVSGKEAAVKSASFTMEAFVKVARLTTRHALVVSKRRNGQTGASWALSVTPGGTLSARFDTQPGAGSGNGFNQCFGVSSSLNDGQWHHVALTFEEASRKVGLYVDYQLCGKGITKGTLVYDDSDLVIGRGLDGWLDEVRLSPEALHPEQFLRPERFFSEMKLRVAYVPLLDQTHSRVQSALKPDLKKLGTLIPKSVPEIETTMWSLGCETLDRNLADWDAYREYLVPLGIKRIRLQGGWNRTEKVKGVYNFAWLDHIVDDAISLGLEVCLETSYNNRLYEPNGATGPGGHLPSGEETLAAWDKWVEAMARRYSAKGVNEWMMYNEPNLKRDFNTPERIVENNIRTAEIIKRINPKAKVGAFVLAGLGVESMETMLTMIKERGKLDLFHWAVYHGYSGNPDRLCERMGQFNAMLKRVAPSIRPWQGEAGCASEEVQYALSGIDWTEYSHAKWNARRMLCDVGCGIESSVFTISDLSYHKDFISRYGLLKTNPDNSLIKVKSAYYTVQNVVTLFNDALTLTPEREVTVTGTERRISKFAFRDKKSGLDVIALWDGTEIPGNGSEILPVQVAVKGGHFKDPVWVDLITGVVYAIVPEQMKAEGGTVTFTNIPLYDGPAAILDRSLVNYEPVKVVRKKKAKAVKSAKPAQGQKPAKAGASPVVAHLLPGTQQPAPAVLILGMKDADAGELITWLNGQDVHAFVLAKDEKPVEGSAEKVKGALAAIRGRAAEWQVKTDAVGVMGQGATGAAAATVAGGHDADFVILIDGADAQASKMAVGAKRVPLFVGKKDAWQTPLAAWLEKFKGKVF